MNVNGLAAGDFDRVVESFGEKMPPEVFEQNAQERRQSSWFNDQWNKLPKAGKITAVAATAGLIVGGAVELANAIDRGQRVPGSANGDFCVPNETRIIENTNQATVLGAISVKPGEYVDYATVQTEEMPGVGFEIQGKAC